MFRRLAISVQGETCQIRFPASPIAETVAESTATARHDLIGYTKIPLIDPMAAQVCSAHAVLLVDTTQHTGDFAEKCQQGDAQRRGRHRRMS